VHEVERSGQKKSTTGEEITGCGLIKL
jgi:hypothetical protein